METKKYKCQYCGRVMDSLDPHNCNNGFRKKGLWFKEIIMEDKKEMVNHPDHYNNGSMECIDAMVGAYGEYSTAEFCKINAFKYLWRLGHKDDEAQEIGKIKWYLDKYLELKKSIEKKIEEPVHPVGFVVPEGVALYRKDTLLKKGLTDREAENILNK
jgi:hypothetical protein